MSALFGALRQQIPGFRTCSLVLRTSNSSVPVAASKPSIVPAFPLLQQARQKSASKNHRELRLARRQRRTAKILAAAQAVRDKKAARFAPARPAPAKMVSHTMHDDRFFRTVTEGKATILIPEGAKVAEDTREVQQVFYNPIQQYNRDLSVLAIKAYGEAMMEKIEARRAERAANPQGPRRNKEKKRKRDVEAEPEPKRFRAIDAASATKAITEPAADETATGSATAEAENTDTAQPSTSVSEQQGQQQQSPETKFKILDALSASGLRALRYGHEIPFVTQIVANDLSASAAKSIQTNVDRNGLQDKITVTNDDALALMYRAIADGLSNRDSRGNQNSNAKFDVIDLDPYGTAAPFLDAAVQAVRDNGGLLCITCTDSAVWAGHSYAEKTFALYGGLPVKGLHSHEAGLRLILNAIATSAARYGLAIEPQLSLSIDFYTKIFVTVKKSPSAVKFLASKTMIVYNCDHGCGAWETQPLMRSQKSPNANKTGYYYKHIASQGPTSDKHCKHCGHRMHMTGPMYAGRIHSRDFIKRILKHVDEADPEVYGTLPRLQGMLQTALDEQIDEVIPAVTQEHVPEDAKENEDAVVDRAPFYVVTAKLAHTLYCQTPPDDMFKGALIQLGYQARRSHCRPGSTKTDAPWSVIWQIMAEWVRQKSPISPSRVQSLIAMPNRPAFKILNAFGALGDAPAAAAEGQVEDRNDDVAQVDDSSAQRKDTKSREKKRGQLGNFGEYHEAADLSEFMHEDLSEKLVFDEALARLGRSNEPRLVRYQANPEPNWGPLTKAKRQ